MTILSPPDPPSSPEPVARRRPFIVSPLGKALAIAAIVTAVTVPLAMTAQVLTHPPTTAAPPAAAVDWSVPAPPATGITPDTTASNPSGISPARSAPPTRIRIPAIGTDAPLTTVGLDEHGVIQAPPLRYDNLAGWYRHGPQPGENGPAVILGHLDTVAGPAVFAHLAKLNPGDVITVARADGTQAIFIVDRLEQVPKTRFPTERVYGSVQRPELRLITCGGSFDSTARSYMDNIIVYAHQR
ncbi:class F sortase [Nonomuraea sp. NPDC050310]|uniref:class F sortase n=1 Tax=Nonomuraea sp. NPDC050310 TaxID=3154935 RepID=UPI00340BC468